MQNFPNTNNDRLTNTEENIPNPKRPFNKLPIVISLEAILAIYTIICLCIKPIPGGKVVEIYLYLAFFSALTLTTIITAVIGECYEKLLVCRLIIRGLYVLNFIFFFDDFYSNSNWYFFLIPVLFALLVISEIWYYIDINRNYSQMVI